jgi:hypothetical protein
MRQENGDKTLSRQRFGALHYRGREMLQNAAAVETFSTDSCKVICLGARQPPRGVLLASVLKGEVLAPNALHRLDTGTKDQFSTSVYFPFVFYSVD